MSPDPNQTPAHSKVLRNGQVTAKRASKLGDIGARLASYRQKNNKLWYYLVNSLQEAVPDFVYRARLPDRLRPHGNFDETEIRLRVNYYNQLLGPTPLPLTTRKLSELRLQKDRTTYYFDSRRVARYFPPGLHGEFLFGDVIHIPPVPAIVKSRPITTDNHHSILLKLNKIRHYIYTDDKLDFRQKENRLVGRGTIRKPERMRFYQMYFDHPLCDLGQINRDGHPHWQKGRLSISEHLRYKFILSLEGNDVASNLKWIMSSQSIAVMPRPKFETWFMEGRLIPNVHYIEIRADYGDLEEKLDYYLTNTEAALGIIHEANRYVGQFRNQPQEDLIALLVMEKYFYKTGQTDYRNNPFYS